ncbi:unnamed protein product [Acanthoscelides obtectus]|uniref:Uncharacterized protein n=1 Tax=Acanthoscelides obtectus TaxID=200917 RepID=A0A9P0NUQ4_ACAOB|nr:unnamed protein product [Acanthoscelides obtectus]CAK1661393.1 Aquaporin AQPcic [Acanthoscelides obtectus]
MDPKFTGIYRPNIIGHPKKPDVESAVIFLIKMVDRQFMNQNGMVFPSAITPSPEPKWVSPDISEKQDIHQKLLKYDHLSMMDRLVLFLAEYLGTAILVFLGCAGCVKYREGSGPGSLEVAFAFGFAIIIAVQTVGHISGAHINPVITLAALIMGVTPLIQVPLYLGGQFLGSLTGYGLLKTLVPQEYIKRSQDNVSLCSPEPNPKLQDAQIVFMEFLLTFFLVLIVCSAWDNRNSTKLDSLAIKLGLAVAGLALVGGGFTGAHLNPARTFGPVLINGDWGYHWVYWVGPLPGSIAGSLFYRIIFQKPLKETEEKSDGKITPSTNA